MLLRCSVGVRCCHTAFRISSGQGFIANRRPRKTTNSNNKEAWKSSHRGYRLSWLYIHTTDTTQPSIHIWDPDGLASGRSSRCKYQTTSQLYKSRNSSLISLCHVKPPHEIRRILLIGSYYSYASFC